MSASVGLMALVVGAACSALLVEHASRIALLPPLAAVLLVVVVKMRHHGMEWHADDAHADDALDLTPADDIKAGLRVRVAGGPRVHRNGQVTRDNFWPLPAWHPETSPDSGYHGQA